MFCTNCGKEIKEGTKFCTGCGTDNSLFKTPQKKTLLTKKRLIISAIILLLSVLVFWYVQSGSSLTTATDQEIATSVVNIYCQNDTDEDASGGSGTIMSKDGLVLTNAHIIPTNTDEETLPICLVILPDPSTGAPDEIYTAYPIVIPEISEQYDLAFVQIDDVFYDHEEGKAYGEYPKIFPAYDPNKYCKEGGIKLGESVRIYGYPSVSGGYALTITDGVVSSLMPDEGLIFTSAKISHGNSGGLAVDANGCRIGVPAMVNGDDYESLGIIISNDLIHEFIDKLQTLYK